MKNLEFNKITGALLLAGLIAMVTGKITDVLYVPDAHAEKRGYQVEVAEAGNTGGAAVAPTVIDIPALMASANAEEGKNVFKKCLACHSVEKGGANKVGPNLWGAVGGKRAGHADFAYSEALKSKAGNWNYDDLFAFIKKPAAYAPGTKMSFAGLSKPEDIANVVAYLRTQSDSPAPLPKK